MKYIDEINKATLVLADQPNAIFLGQSVAYKGNAIFRTLKDVPDSKKLELPVFEETQMGMSIGLAMQGFLPISVYPRFNFLLLAFNQLINHLDKIPLITNNVLIPKVIIKVMVGSVRPLDPGIQHKGNFTEGLKLMLDTVRLYDLQEPEQIMPAYESALKDPYSSILVEYGDFYKEK